MLFQQVGARTGERHVINTRVHLSSGIRIDGVSNNRPEKPVRSYFASGMNFKKFGCILAAGFAAQINLACKASENSEKIAEVDGLSITRAEVDRAAGKPLSSAREQVYKLERQKLDEYIGATLLTSEAKRHYI